MYIYYFLLLQTFAMHFLLLVEAFIEFHVYPYYSRALELIKAIAKSIYRAKKALAIYERLHD